jgi:hypothetical protein
MFGRKAGVEPALRPEQRPAADVDPWQGDVDPWQGEVKGGAHGSRCHCGPWGWFIGWITLGYAAGSLLFSTPWTGAITGFAFALAAVPAWPWVMPETVNAWIDDLPAWR